MKRFIVKYKLELTGMLIGAGGGWGYWFLVGCSTGACPITSSPVNSTAYGALMGALLFSSFKNDKKTEKTNQ